VSGDVGVGRGGILEQAVLDVRPGRAEAFEVAFAQARAIISAVPGFGGLSLSRSLERPDRFLLLVRWATLEDHTEGFRGSAGYQEWKRLLHDFYDPFPEVEHFVQVASA
jgi:heme-degrading monooxygenase HmoA